MRVGIQHYTNKEQIAVDTEETDFNHSVPYSFLIGHKYGGNYGECGYHCSGCNLRDLKDSVMRIGENENDTPAIGIQWKYGAGDCFNHDAFLSPCFHKSALICTHEI